MENTALLSRLMRQILVSSWLMSIIAPMAAETLIGRVVGISDGDTITVLDDTNRQHKIRLIGIDAPEKHQDSGNRAKQNLSDLVYGKTVRVEWSKADRYGRTLGKVLADGKDAALSQVMAGLAWHYKAYETEQSSTDRQAYADAEIAARTQRIGLWTSSCPTPPWDYRRGNPPVTSSACSCDSHQVCTGPRGGRYCITSGGSKRYGAADIARKN